MNLPFEYPAILALIPLGIIAVFKLVRQKGRLGFSSTALLKGVGPALPLLLLERLFLAILVVAAALILARPTRLVKNSVPVYQEARDITLVIDTSGSMSGENITTAAKVSTEFIAGRPNDRIGLISFNDFAFLEWPLSLDHESLVYRLGHLKAQGGTVIAAGMIAGLAQLQDSKNPGAIIVVSDGGSQVTPEEKETIQAIRGQTRIYWIWIKEGSEEDEVAAEFGLYLKEIGGTVYEAGVEDLPQIFDEIDQLEASPVLYEQRVVTTYNFGLLPYLAVASLLFAGLVEMVREV